jgi:alpha-tubulin suppressor-like RCC1 family protein
MGHRRRAFAGLSIIGACAAFTYACVGDDPTEMATIDGGSGADGAPSQGDSSTGPDAACEGLDLQNDAKNCGACGRVCGEGFSCKAGACDSAVVLLAAGEGHNCAVLQRGDLYCWGRNGTSQLGIGAPSESAPPTAIPRDSRAATIPALTSLALGNAHSCGLRPDGSMLCWGSNQYGQLSTNDTGPDGGNISERVPTPAMMKTALLSPTTLQYKELAQGPRANHACAVTAEGNVYCWGWNEASQANFDTNVESECGEQDISRCVPLPSAVAISGVGSVALGATSTCAVRNDGGVACWGQNLHGQLGNGAHSNLCLSGPACTRPAQVVNLPGAVTRVAIGNATACAVLADKTVWCWGYNTNDLLGFAHGTDAGDECCNVEPGCLHGNYCRPRPIQIQGISNAVSVTLGADHACVLHEDHSVSCWGASDKGQLGNGELTKRLAPTKVVDLPPAAGVAAGAGHTCAWTADGRAFCWGLNDSGQLGSGTANASKPVQVPLP